MGKNQVTCLSPVVVPGKMMVSDGNNYGTLVNTTAQKFEMFKRFLFQIKFLSFHQNIK